MVSMSLRALLATLFAFAMLLAPLGIPSGSAMAMPPADHQMQMMESSHCDAGQSSDKQDQKKSGMPCSAAMCAAITVASASPGEALIFHDVIDQPRIEQFGRSFLIELATPPPRLA